MNRITIRLTRCKNLEQEDTCKDVESGPSFPKSEFDIFMRYSESLDYLNSFVNFEQMVDIPKNQKWNIKRMQILLDWFSYPDRAFLPILIAGTKGKGSTGFFLESILVSSRISTGFYSSPHLEDPRERIRIGSRIISKILWREGLDHIRKTLARHSLPTVFGRFTYFEIMTILAILIFKKMGVQIGIFEVGMGGRLDATNVLNTKLVILTPIHLDHEAILGNTISKIAREKAAVIRPLANVVVSPQTKDAMKVIRQQVRDMRAQEWAVLPLSRFKLGLVGDHQKINAGAARKAAILLREKHFFHSITNGSIRKGLVKRDWPGRFEMVKGKPDFLLDVAHNPSSVEALVRNLKRLFLGRKSILIFGVSRDKNWKKMLKTLSAFFSEVVLSPTTSPRSQNIGSLSVYSKRFFKSVISAATIQDALAVVKKKVTSRTLIVVTGSFYLVGEVRKMLRSRNDLPPGPHEKNIKLKTSTRDEHTAQRPAPSSIYAESRAALLTQHGKEGVIASVLNAALGCRVERVTGYDTDLLGTFTRDIPRAGIQLEAARKKARIGMELSGLSLGLASEGSFGPDPMVGMFPWNVEFLIFLDDGRGLEVVGVAQGKANFSHLLTADWTAVADFAKQAGFPEHHLVVRPESQDDTRIRKGIAAWPELETVFAWALAESANGRVFVETDMRAHVNPTRMDNIRLAAEDLVKKLHSLCPVCSTPGFWIVDHMEGLACMDCGTPTREIRAEVYGCLKCAHRFTREHPDRKYADPGRCDNCNP